jgi:membrane protease YdiL (CAAX protease family)
MEDLQLEQATSEPSEVLQLESPLVRAVPIHKPLSQAPLISRGKLLVQGVRKRVRLALGQPLLPLILTLVIFAGMMGVSFVQGMYGIYQAKQAEEQQVDWDNFDEDLENAKLRSQLILETLIAEGLDTFLVFLGLLIIARPPQTDPKGTWPFAFLLSPFALFAVLSINIGFAYLLRLIAEGSAGEPAPENISLGWSQGILAILLVCAQPAIIEELFFRHLLLGHLRPHLGIHLGVLISSIVFGMAHLGGIIAWPILMLAGVMLGYARVYSGGLILPIILHFAHNFFVLLLNHVLFKS